jgi:hypothetical protein
MTAALCSPFQTFFDSAIGDFKFVVRAGVSCTLNIGVNTNSDKCEAVSFHKNI